MNICFLLGGFQSNGGIGRVTSILVNEFSKDKKYSVSTISYKQEENLPLLYDIAEDVKQMHLYEKSTSMAKAMLTGHAVGKVRSIIIENKIDILISCGALFYPLGIIACKKTNAKCICWEHTNPAIKTDYRFQNMCRKFAIKFSDKMIVLTKSAYDYYLNEMKIERKKLNQIYNPVSGDVLQSVEYDINAKQIISVGRLAYPKNFSRLLDIAKEVLSRHPGWKWDIYGTGEEYDSLRMKIKELGLQELVCLKGQINNIYEIYQKYAFLVMTSRYEGFPMSLIEAGANRLPLVSFDIQTGPNEIINNGVNGYLINHEDNADMIHKIEQLMTDDVLRMKMSQESYKIMKKFDMTEVLNEWKEIFQQEMK